MALKELPDFMKKGNNKENLVCVNIGGKMEYITIAEAGLIANSIITQLQIIGIGNVSQAGTSDDKTDISRKTGSGA